MMNNSLYISLAILCLGGAVAMMLTDIAKSGANEVWQFRKSQLREIQINTYREIAPLLIEGGIVVDDYFERSKRGFRYLGGLYGAPWKVDSFYAKEELKPGRKSDTTPGLFYHQPLRGDNFYVIIDRGGENATKEYLKVLDIHGFRTLDTLYIDFRFLRAIEFGSILRLFNQIAPQGKIILGTSIDSHQEQAVWSSGKPFFIANQTIFLVNKYVPAPVKRLIMDLDQLPSYDFKGSMGQVADTVCLFSQFIFGPDIYRVCTGKWTGSSHEFGESSPRHSMKDSILNIMMQEVDEVWFKKQDSMAMRRIVPVIVREL